jgi:hypothetical protein
MDLTLTAVIARRKKDGKLVLVESTGKPGGQLVVRDHELDENSDRALDLYAFLKKSKGEGGKYTEAVLFIRSKKTNRRLKFG